MNVDRFWEIVEASRDKDMDANGAKLFGYLSALSDEELLALDEIWSDHYRQLFSWPLWGVAYLAQGGCSDDGFMDWRNWIIACGREAFETALNRPDDLVALIDAEPNAGREGINSPLFYTLKARNLQPKRNRVPHPREPSGMPWNAEEDLRPLLPNTYARYMSGSAGM
jgi:hypothetical protein